MKRFFIVGLIVIGLFFVMRLFSGGAPVSIASGSTLIVEVEGRYVEASTGPLLQRVLGGADLPFVGLLSRFSLAALDDRVERVVVVIRPVGMGWAKVGEVRDSILRLREGGKEVIAYLEMASFSAGKEYYLATAADRIYVIPGGTVPLVGLAAEYLYLGGLFEKVGVEFDVAKAGRYKSAVESYSGTGMSDASREMANSLLDDVNDTFRDAIARGRGLERGEVDALIDLGPILSTELLELGLIDGIIHLDALLEELGGEAVWPEKFALVTLEDLGVTPEAQIALIYGSGNVVVGKATRGGDPVFAARTTGKALLEAAEDPNVDAIIVRIDSPGGSSLASEQIWDAMTRAREHGKPVIASFSDLAASGGYYAATGADYIVSGANTLTGSIGVFALRPTLGGALAKIGVTVEALSRGRHADFLLSEKPLSAGALARLQASVLDTYALFLERVADAREMETSAVDDVAQGRVWTGRQAYERGLVDELGGLHVAVRYAKGQLGLEDDATAVLVPYPPAPTLSEELVDLMNRGGGVSLLAPLLTLPLPESVVQLEAMLSRLPVERPLLVPPMLIDIH